MESKQIGDIVRRIPIFQSFSGEQLGRMLHVCRLRAFRTGEHVFTSGDPSGELLVLLSGRFLVLAATGDEIASIGSMGLVGEMGVLTDSPRSATVVAVQESRALAIARDDLFGLIESDKDMGFKIYRNVTAVLCDRLRDNNILLEQQYLILEGYEEDEGAA